MCIWEVLGSILAEIYAISIQSFPHATGVF